VDPITYTYDALGNRISRTIGGATTDFVINYGLGLPSVSIERDGLTDVRYYVHSPNGELLYSISASDNSRRHYHYDELGNTQFLTDDGGSVTASYAYDPHGELLSETGNADQPFTWQGQHGVMREPGGVYFMRARYYDSTSGRFLSRDPVKSIRPRNINPYQYALNNPLYFVDPTGREITSEDVLDGVEFGLVGVVAAGTGFLVGLAAPVGVVSCEIVGVEAAIAAMATTECVTTIGGLSGFLNARQHRDKLRAEGRRQRQEMKDRARQRQREKNRRLADLRKQRDREWYYASQVCDADLAETPNHDAVSRHQEQENADYRRWVPGASYDSSRGKPYDIGHTRGDDAAEIFSDAPHSYDLDDKYEPRDRWERDYESRQDKRMQELMEQLRRKRSKREAQVEKAPAGDDPADSIMKELASILVLC
jgi:RHS repeat-associated protein